MIEDYNIDSLRKKLKNLEDENQRLQNQLQEAKQLFAAPVNKANKQLNELQNQFMRLANLLPQTVWETNNQGVFTYVNHYAEVEFGYKYDEIVGKLSIVDTVVPNERHLVVPKTFEGGTGIEFTMLHKDGSTFAGLVHYSPIIRNNSFEGLQGIITNITEQKDTQNRLKESEEKYRLLVENQNDLVVKVNPNGEFLYLSPSYCKYFGKTESELLGKSFLPLIHPDDQEPTSMAMKALYTEPYSCYIEQRVFAKNEWRWLAWLDTSILDDKNNVQEIIGVGRDITLQKLAEYELHESNQRNSAILKAIPDIMFVFNREGIFLDCHTPKQELLLKTPEEFIGKKIDENAPPYLADLNREKLTALFKTGETQTYSYSIEIDGKTWDFDARMVKLGEDKALAIVRDITEQKRIEEALRQSEENYHTIFQLANDSIFIHHPQTGEIIDANKAAIESYGLKTLDELKESNIWSEPPYSQAEANQWIKRTINEGPQVFEWRNVRANGNVFWEEVHLSKVKLLGADRVISICRNITIRKSIESKLQRINKELKIRTEEYAALVEEYATQNEELQRAKQKAEESDKLKSAFLANMSHEIRTPMNAIIGFASLLDKGEINPEKQKQFAQIIRKRSSDLLKIIDDILDISKIEANQIVLQPQKGSIKGLLNEIFEYSFIKAELNPKPEVRLGLVNQVGEIDEIVTDFGRVKQVLFNLIENALKFTKQGEIQIGCKRNDANSILFYVRDTGSGISEDHLTKVFERFHQAHNTKDPSFGGTGLGLAISKGLVELLGGKIWVESEIGQGTTFSFTIPIDKKNGFKTNSSLVTLEQGVKLNETFLIVDDDAINASFIKEILLSAGAELWIASHTESALEIAKTHPQIGIVLLDNKFIYHQETKIFELLKDILPDCKIIIQSAFASPEDKNRCKEDGCDGYITKPVSPTSLISTILDIIKE